MTSFPLASLLLLLAALFGVLNHLLLRLPNLIGVLVFALIASGLLMAVDPWIPSIDLTQWARGLLQAADLPKVLASPRLRGAGERVAGAAVLLRLRGLRCVWMLRQAAGGQV